VVVVVVVVAVAVWRGCVAVCDGGGGGADVPCDAGQERLPFFVVPRRSARVLPVTRAFMSGGPASLSLLFARIIEGTDPDPRNRPGRLYVSNMVSAADLLRHKADLHMCVSV